MSYYSTRDRPSRLYYSGVDDDDDDSEPLVTSPKRGGRRGVNEDFRSPFDDIPDYTPQPDEFAESKNLGTKTIGTLGSIVLYTNNIHGSAMLAVPIIFQQAGWLIPSVFLFFMALVGTFSATLLCEAITMIPGNSNFQRRVEFTTAVRYYFSNKWYIFSQVLLNVCLQSQIIVGIIVSAQVMDEFLIFLFGKSYAIMYLPRLALLVLDSDSQDPYAGVSDGYFLSLGFVISLLLIVPMGYFNLESQMAIQYASFLVLLLVCGEFFWQFFQVDWHFHQTPLVGQDFSRVLGVIMFAFAHVVTIPSWANEKRPYVSVTKTVWISTWANFALYLVFGLFGAWCYPHMKSADFLVVLGRPHSPLVTKLAVMMFSLGTIAPGIPVHSITVRYNLYVSRMMGSFWSSFWGVVAPWLVAAFVYKSHAFSNILNWSAITVNGVINFAVPLATYIKARSVTNPHDIPVDAYKGVPAGLRRLISPITLAFSLILLTLVLAAFAVCYDLFLLVVEHENVGAEGGIG